MRSPALPWMIAALLAPGVALAESTDATDAADAGVLAQVDEDADADAALSADVADDDEEADASEEEADDGLLPFGVSASLNTGTSLGAISRPNAQTSDGIRLGFGLGLSYPFDNGLRAGLNLGWSKFVTAVGGSNYQYEGRWSDTSLSLGHGSVATIPGADINVSVNGSLSLPTSAYSQQSRLYTAMRVGTGLSRSFGSFSTSYSFGVSKNFHRYTTSVQRLDNAAEADRFARDGGNERLAGDLVALETGILPEWGISHSIGLGYRFDFGLSASLGWSFADSWSYADETITDEDEFTAPDAVSGRGHSQSMSGSIGLSYAFLDHYSVSASMSTGGPPKTADNDRVRFPFFDTQSGNLQYTSLGLALSASW
jgi:hypothetical protein